MAIALSNFPFKSWVPKPLGVFIILFLFVPVLFINGTYSSNIGEMTSSLGIISEHLQFANFATAAGMVIFTPFIRRYLEIRRPKMVYIAGLVILVLFSYLCARSRSIPFLIVCSFLTGFVRMTLIFNGISCYILYVKGRDMTMGMRHRKDPLPEETVKKMNHGKNLFLARLYIFFLSIGQLGSFVTAYLAYSYEWQYAYYFMMALALFALALVEISMSYQKRLNTARLNMKKFGDTVLASLLLLSFSFVLIYGKTLDWFNSKLIMAGVCIFFISLGCFILLEFHSRKRPYFDFRTFDSREIIIAIVLFILGMGLNGSSLLVSAYTGLSMTIDNLQNAQLSNWSLLGYLIGTVLVYYMCKKDVPFRYIFLVSFTLTTISAVYMYFQLQSEGLYNNLIFPVVIRSAGMIICYGMGCALGLSSITRTPHRHNSFIFIMLTMRSIVGPVVGTSFYSNALYERENYYVSRLSEDVDMLNPLASAQFTQAQNRAMAQGKSYENAQILASMSISKQIRVQAALAGLKEIAGWTIWAGAGCIILILLLPFRKVP